jgi:methyltransferase-like protein
MLEERASDRIEREQYLDFLKMRRFRQTLLVRDDCELSAMPLDEPIARFFVASPARSISLEGANGSSPVETFEGGLGGALATDSPLVRAAIHVLMETWPRRLSFNTLCSRSLDRVSSGALGPPRDGEDCAFLRRFLLPFFALGIVRFHALSPDLADNVADRPVAHPLVRWQARRSQVVMTPLGNVVGLESGPVRTLVQLLDGTRSRTALLAALTSDGSRAVDAAGLERVLEGLCRHGMLV